MGGLFRALKISDIHMSNRLPNAVAGEGGVTDRLQEQLELWQRVTATARDARVNVAFVLGDLLDKSLVDAITLKGTVQAISELARVCPVYILPGNHEAVDNQGLRFTVEAFGEFGNDRIIYMKTARRLTFPGFDWLGFWPMEYCSTEMALNYLSKIRARMAKGRRTSEVLLMHHSILGCRFAGWTCDDGLDPEQVCSGFDWVFSGHFHDPQKFGPDGRGLYLGAPMHHRLDDVGREAGYWLVDYREDGTVKRKFVHGLCAKFHQCAWPETMPKGAKKGDYIKIVVSATSAEWEMIKGAVDTSTKALRAAGYRAKYQHKPVYHHSSRIHRDSDDDESTIATPEQMLRAYVKSPDVDKSGLDPKRLLKLGRQALESVKSAAKDA